MHLLRSPITDDASRAFAIFSQLTGKGTDRKIVDLDCSVHSEAQAVIICGDAYRLSVVNEGIQAMYFHLVDDQFDTNASDHQGCHEPDRIWLSNRAKALSTSRHWYR
jgi:hypothetical protein